MPDIVHMPIPPGGEPVLDHPREDRRVAGCPERLTWTSHESGPMTAGTWHAQPGRWRIVFPETRQEYFFVLEGHVRLHAPDGRSTDVKAGEGAVIPPGFVGEFEVVAAVKKQFVLVDQEACEGGLAFE